LARIRTIKPEAFVSESLAAVSLTAERTFFGLLTQADDQGRHRDHAAIIAGQLWVLRPDLLTGHLHRPYTPGLLGIGPSHSVLIHLDPTEHRALARNAAVANMSAEQYAQVLLRLALTQRGGGRTGSRP
jgi:hypothetical protein